MKSAIADFTRAIEINPRHAAAYNNRGGVELERGNLDHEIADFDQAIKLNLHMARAYLNRGMARLLQGQEAASQHDFAQCLKLKPDLQPVIEQRVKTIKEWRKESGR